MADINNGATPEEPLKGPVTDTVEFEPAEPLKSTGDAGVMFQAETEAAKRGTAQTLKEEASKYGSQAAEKVRAYADDGKEKASGAIDEFAKMMFEAADTVDSKLGAQYGQYARGAADTISGFADSLRSREIDDLIEDARGFVRKSPAIAIGVAAGVGFVLARLIKSGVDAVADQGDDASPRSPKA
jgi:ElaB/YqjD/DUF883 family membrane-anchored ribosome-binding protein